MMRILRTVQICIDYSKLDDLNRIREVQDAVEMAVFDLERKVKTLVRSCVCGQPALANVAVIEVRSL